ncbi:MAG: hypothetical protein LBM25_03875 [Bacteroidales bacterium]|jgi:hypothetical protein|nr:hypothetical protein [Bacteroidales bacterium]
MKLKFILMWLFIATSFFLFSQNNELTIKYDTTIFSDIQTDCIGVNLETYILNDTLYFIETKKADKDITKIIVNGFDIKTNIFFKFYLNFLNDNYVKSRSSLHNFWINDDYIYASLGNRVYRYEKNEDENYYSNSSYITKPILKGDIYSADVYKLNNDTLLFYRHYLNTNMHFDKSTFWYLYSLKDQKIIKEREYLDCPSPILTYYSPNKVMCFNSTNVFYTPANEYKINIYDYNLNIIDSISLTKKSNWVTIDKEKELKTLNKYEFAVERLYEMSKYIWDSSSAILKIQASDEYLLVFYRLIINKEAKYFHDIWRKENDKWVLRKETISQNDDELSTFSDFVLRGNEIFKFSYKTPLKREDYKNENEFNKAEDKYKIDNDCLLTIDKYHIDAK